MSSSLPTPLLRITPTTFAVRSFDETAIYYDLYPAPGRDLVLIVPGFWRDRRHPSMVRMAEMFLDLGFAAAICDVRGHGDSEGTYGFNLHEHYDVAAVAKDILKRLPVERIVLTGLSYGGAIAVTTAARHRLPLSSLVLVSPVADFAMIAPRINPFTIHRHILFSQAMKAPRFDWRLLRSSKISAVDDIRDVSLPVCFIHVKDDWLITHKHSVALFHAANEPKELHVLDIPGNYHADRLFSVAADSVEPLIAGFLARHGRNSSPDAGPSLNDGD